MRKYFLTFVALAAGLFATSCQESIVEPQIAGPTTFTVQIPDQMGTKAIGGHDLVDKLYVQVYPEDVTADMLTSDIVIVENDGTAKVSFNLVQDQKYNIVFWAQKEGAYKTQDLRRIPMNLNHHNNESGAAFFAFLENFIPTGTAEPVVLRRPFAQLNIRTTESSLENHAGKFELGTSKVTVTGLADVFNTVEGYGEVSKDYVFEAVAVPVEDVTIGGIDYKYVSMDYLPIVGDDKALATVGLEITLKDNQVITHSWDNIPLQENYKTNIFGNLISSSTDFNVTIDDSWAPYEYNFDDLEQISTGVIYDPNQKTFFLDGVSGLQWYAEQSNGVTKSAVVHDRVNQSVDKGNLTVFGGQTVVLTSDVDLQGVAWTPIGKNNTIAGTFDGGDHVISNLTVTGTEKRVGLFASTGSGMTIKNVRMNNVNIEGSDYAGAIVGYGMCARIENCHVDGGSITVNVLNNDGGAKAGGIVGYLTAQNVAHLKGASVKNMTIRAFRDVAGAVGMAQGTACIIDDVLVENVTVIADRYIETYKDNPFPAANAGEVVGRRDSNPDPTNVTVNNVVVKVLEVDANGNATVGSQEDFNYALKHGATNITVETPGTYSFPVAQGKDLTIKGNKEVVFTLTSSQALSGTGVTFEGVTIQGAKEIYKGYYHTKYVTFKDCQINDMIFLYSPTNFENCVFNSTAEHCVWTYSADEAIFKNCEFTYVDRAINVYGENAVIAIDVLFENCKFNTENQLSLGAVEINSGMPNTISATVNMNNCTAPQFGEMVFIPRWDSLNGERTTVYVNGELYDTPIVHAVVKDAAGLAKAVKDGCTVINLLPGEYDVYGCGGKNLILNGTKDVVFKLMNEGEDGCDYGFGGNGTGVGSYVFNGLTINTLSNTGNYKGYAYMKGTFNDCAFIGSYSLNNANDYTFNNCTFDTQNGYFWTWGATSVTFNGCEWGTNSKAILAHGYANTVINIKNCKFNATEKGYTGAGDWTSVVEIDPAGSNHYTINFTGENTKTDFYSDWTRVKDGSTGHIIYGL